MKWLRIINEYARLLAEEIKITKLDKVPKHKREPQIVMALENQVEELKNIIALENVSNLKNFKSWARQKGRLQKSDLLRFHFFFF